MEKLCLLGFPNLTEINGVNFGSHKPQCRRLSLALVYLLDPPACAICLFLCGGCSCDGCSDLWSVWLLMVVFVIGFDCRGLVVWKFMVDFYLGVKWAPDSAFKPYPKVL
ncbi:hypothetical protein F2Q70_00011596 [Brassica cretica]|uniref:Transmembrane protein n=1 Tax=Brassica cretica TaxID=69181 RepID=A0A8S9M397_BRACR|nr:hypothetical protein F2Q70_00011596 [Brassica cretica]KAF3544812.1 hypothetical protein DY000_02006979 [Brassica cretica]